MAKDFQFLHKVDGKWVEGDETFDFILNSDKEFPFKLLANRAMKNITIKLKTEVPYDLAIVDALSGMRVFTYEDTYSIPSLAIKKSKYLVLKLRPEKTGDYKVSFAFDYLVK